MKPSRRRFLETGALAGAALGLGRTGFGDPRVAAAQAPPALSWIDKPMRWAQLTLVEDDPVSFDVGFWLDYFRKTRSDAVCLSAGGCVAYYPTRVPFHHRSAWLGEQDVFGELVAGCRKLGMVVVARTDPTPPTTTCRPRIPTGSRSTPPASRAATGPRPRCG
jgi:hypothetical protein